MISGVKSFKQFQIDVTAQLTKSSKPLLHFKHEASTLHVPTLLTVKGLRKAFGGQLVLKDLNLELRQGEVVLLRGENGSGKTTLLNILTGNLEPDAGTIEYSVYSPCKYSFPRGWWQRLSPWDNFRPECITLGGIGRTWQDVRLFRAQSLRENIAVATPGQPGENPIQVFLAPNRVRRTERKINDNANAMLARLGLTGREASYSSQISFGQAKRVAIARAVAAGARIIFLDEPLAGLDHAGITNVLDFLKQLVREQGVTLVVVEHVFNHSRLRSLVTTDWLLKGGKLLPNKIMASSTKHNGAQHRSRHPWLDLFIKDDSSLIDEPLPNGGILTRIQRSDRGKEPHKVILEVRNLVVKRGSCTVVGLDDNREESGISFRVLVGGLIVLQAPNGWGKSTLLAAIAGLVPVQKGEILLNNQIIGNLPTWQRIRSGLRMVPSNGNSFPGLKAKEVMKLAGQSDAMPSLGSFSVNRTSELSGGQRQRLAILAEPKWPPILVRMLDEPFANLDASAVNEITLNILSQATSAIFIALPLTNL